MNVALKRHLPRRTFLRGLGAAIGLPFLDAMRPALTFAAAKPPCRMAFLYFPNGVQPDSWFPPIEGDIATLSEGLSRVLEPLIPYRNDILLLGGLTNDGGRAKGDGPGDHGRAGAAYLTGMHPKKTFGKEIQAGVSIDQVVANSIGSATRFPSLQLACEDGIQGGNCDNGYSCAYSNSISWRTPSTPNPPEIRPRARLRAPVRQPRIRSRPRAPRPRAALQPERARFGDGGHAPPARHARRLRPAQN